MTDGDGGEEDGGSSDLFELVSVDDLRGAGLQRFLSDHASADEHALEDALRREASRARDSHDEVAARVFGLLAQIMSMHMRVEDVSGPFGPMLVMGGRRSMIPADLRGAERRHRRDYA